jgi:hypothetical protein
MTKTLNQSNSSYYVDLNINNKIKRTFTFKTKLSAFTFFLNYLKQISFTLCQRESLLISAILYKKNLKNSKHVLAKKNLTRIFNNDSTNTK